MKTFREYGPCESDVFLAAAHLLGGMSKYDCKFNGKTPKHMYPLEPSVLAFGCLKVLKRNLSKHNYLLVLLALSLRYCDWGNLRDQGIITTLSKTSYQMLISKVHKQLKNASSVHFSFSKYVLSKLTLSDKEYSPPMARMARYVMGDCKFLSSLHLFRSGARRSLTLCPALGSKLLMFGNASGICGETLAMLMHTYWTVVIYDDSNYKMSYSFNNKQILLKMERILLKDNPKYSHLQEVSEASRATAE